MIILIRTRMMMIIIRILIVLSIFSFVYCVSEDDLNFQTIMFAEQYNISSEL